MDTWSKLTEFFATGMVVLPTTLGVGMDSLEIFVAALGAMQILLVCVGLGGAPLPEHDKGKARDKKSGH